MVPSFGMLMYVGFVIGVGMWSQHVFSTFHKDLELIRNSDDSYGKAAIVFMWLLTVVLLIILARILAGAFITITRLF